MPKIQRNLALCGAVLFLAGLIAGFWSALGLSGTVALKAPRLSLAVHLNGLLGGLWLIAVASTFPLLNYANVQFFRLAILVGVPAWANVFITLWASVLGKNGLVMTGDRENDEIALLLRVLVVAPSLVGNVYWVRGFLSKGAGK